VRLCFGIVEILLCALKKYLFTASLIMLNNFVTNLVIQNVKKIKIAGRPANSPINGAGFLFEPKHLCWSALPSPLLGNLNGRSKQGGSAHFATPLFDAPNSPIQTSPNSPIQTSTNSPIQIKKIPFFCLHLDG
jgi:hypothetical protein